MAREFDVVDGFEFWCSLPSHTNSDFRKPRHVLLYRGICWYQLSLNNIFLDRSHRNAGLMCLWCDPLASTFPQRYGSGQKRWCDFSSRLYYLLVEKIVFPHRKPGFLRSHKTGSVWKPNRNVVCGVSGWRRWRASTARALDLWIRLERLEEVDVDFSRSRAVIFE